MNIDPFKKGNKDQGVLKHNFHIATKMIEDRQDIYQNSDILNICKKETLYTNDVQNHSLRLVAAS